MNIYSHIFSCMFNFQFSNPAPEQNTANDCCMCAYVCVCMCQLHHVGDTQKYVLSFCRMDILPLGCNTRMCCVILCFVILCFVILCFVILCFVILCFVICVLWFVFCGVFCDVVFCDIVKWIYSHMGDTQACDGCWEVGGWGREPKKCTGRDWGMGLSTI